MITAGAVGMESVVAETTAPEGETGTEERPMTWTGMMSRSLRYL